MLTNTIGVHVNKDKENQSELAIKWLNSLSDQCLGHTSPKKI